MGVRFLFYCHDTFGLGHFRRTLSLAKHFTAMLPDAEALNVTGTPLAPAFELPPRVDCIKLPAVTKRSNGTYVAHSLTLEFTAMRDRLGVSPRRISGRSCPTGLERGGIVYAHLPADHAPYMLVCAQIARHPRSSHLVRHTWTQEEVYSTLEQLYHLILVYGSQRLFDIVTEYALSSTVAQRVRFHLHLNTNR